MEEIEFYKEEVRKNPDDALAHNNLGVVYRKLGKNEEAIDSHKHAIRLDPDYVDAHYNLGVVYRKSGKYQEAIDSYKQAIRIDPDFVEAHSNLGLAYYLLGNYGNYKKAIESYKKALRIDPDYAEAYMNLGNAYGELGKNEEEIESYKQAIRIDPDDEDAHNNLGVAYRKCALYCVSGEEWGFDGHSRINHDYNLKTIGGNKVVVDNTTGLMWHQSGSDDKMKWYEAHEWIKKLNKGSWLSKGGYAGYCDWRLPTVEEAASLLEPSKKNGLYIAPVFSSKQSFIWASDRHGSMVAWYVGFISGSVSRVYYDSNCVRPVRSVE